LYALLQILGLTASNARPVRMDNSDIIGFGQLIERRVTEPSTHQSTAKQDHSIAVRIAEVCVRNSIGCMSAGVWTWWKNVALMETDVAKEVENRHAKGEIMMNDNRRLGGGYSEDIEVDKNWEYLVYVGDC
jgi:hypothetical protein